MPRREDSPMDRKPPTPRRWAALAAVVCALTLSACGAAPEDGGNGTLFVSGPADTEQATVSLQGRDLTLTRGTEAAVEFVSHQGLARSYVVIRPQGLTGPRPVLMLLHGNEGNPQAMANIADISALVATEQVIAVLPEAQDGEWAEDPADTRGIDDIGLLDRVLGQLQRNGTVDASRVYLSGFSNGGAMTQRYACANPAGFAAYGVVAAVLRPLVAASCNTAVARPIVYMLGTADPLVPYEGIEGVASAEDAANFWATAQGCTGSERQALPNRAPLDLTTTELQRFTGCREGSEVRLYTIERGGHAWPGDRSAVPLANIGSVSRDFSATTTFWAIFAPYRR